jgi:hypothetical protein
MGGLWAAVVGGAGFVILFAVLQPIYRWTDAITMIGDDCPDSDGRGTFGPLAYTAWEFVLPYSALAWVLAVVLEQVAEPARRNRSLGSYLVRAGLAVVGSVVLACLLPVGVTIVCPRMEG